MSIFSMHFREGQIADDAALPFFAPIIPADEVIADLDRMSDGLNQKTLSFANFDRQAKEKIQVPSDKGGWNDYAFVPMTEKAIAIVDPNRGIHTPSPAHLYIQQGADSHHHPDFMILVYRDTKTGTTHAVAAETVRFVLPAAQSRDASSAMNLADIHDATVTRRLNGREQSGTELKARIIGDGKAFDPARIFTPIPEQYIAGLMHHYMDLLAPVIKPEFKHTCHAPRLRGFFSGVKQVGTLSAAQ